MPRNAAAAGCVRADLLRKVTHAAQARSVIRMAQHLFPGLPQAVCVNSAFHATRRDYRSGLLGISGLSGDMRTLHEAAGSNPDIRLAIEMFCHSARKQLAALISVQDGADLILFTRRIGKNDGPVRAAICKGLAWTGVSLNDERNRFASDPVSSSNSRCEVRVLASQEDWQIVRHNWSLVMRGHADAGP